MDFPAVTICNVNAIRISKLTKDDVYHVGQFFGLIQSDGVSEKVRVHLIGKGVTVDFGVNFMSHNL